MKPGLILSSKKLLIAALTCCQLAFQASAGTFNFSTGQPDGKVATLSRPAGPDKVQTETADDFFLTEQSVITHATFTGLVPLGTDPASIRQVEIEIYHVFPGDSALPPSGAVLTQIGRAHV